MYRNGWTDYRPQKRESEIMRTGVTPMELIEHGAVRTCGGCKRRRRVKDWHVDALQCVILLCRECTDG